MNFCSFILCKNLFHNNNGPGGEEGRKDATSREETRMGAARDGDSWRLRYLSAPRPP